MKMRVNITLFDGSNFTHQKVKLNAIFVRDDLWDVVSDEMLNSVPLQYNNNETNHTMFLSNSLF